MPKPIPSHDDVRSAFDDGSIINASKEDLERFLVANGQARILHEANQARASEMGETMRQLLAARQSQEMHSEALRISNVALWVSVFALFVGLVGAYLTKSAQDNISSISQQYMQLSTSQSPTQKNTESSSVAVPPKQKFSKIP